jgi:hypothetical protein
MYPWLLTRYSLGGVVVSVLATGPQRLRVQNPANAIDFYGPKKSAAHLPLEWEVKWEGPMS